MMLMQLRNLFLALGISPVHDGQKVQSQVQRVVQGVYLVQVTHRIR